MERRSFLLACTIGGLGLAMGSAFAREEQNPANLRVALGLSQEIFKSLVAKGSIDGDKVIVLAESDPIPNYPMVMQGYLAPELKSAISKAFLELSNKEILKTFRAEAFTPTDDRAYDILRETAKLLDLDLSKLKG